MNEWARSTELRNALSPGFPHLGGVVDDDGVRVAHAHGVRQIFRPPRSGVETGPVGLWGIIRIGTPHVTNLELFAYLAGYPTPNPYFGFPKPQAWVETVQSSRTRFGTFSKSFLLCVTR